ncbi:MAG TPA: SH3 domain-containing protein [Xanthobacteraceae bacterium]|nr:SH3 domain-containing protein [Xanthobacteraceae bacterium]
MKQVERKPHFDVGLRERIQQESAMTARLKRALLAASFLGLLTGATAADPATVVTIANLRTGPGIEYPIRVAIPGGATVDVQGCDGSWCVARYAGYEGYISQPLVAGGGAPGPGIAAVPDDEYYDEGPGPGYGYGYYGRDYRPSVRRDLQDNNRRSNWQGRGQQSNRGNWQANRDGGNWQQRSGGQGGVRVQQQQNIRATAPRAQAPAAARAAQPRKGTSQTPQ